MFDDNVFTLTILRCNQIFIVLQTEREREARTRERENRYVSVNKDDGHSNTNILSLLFDSSS